jgi:hypothetical protein
MVRIKRIHLSSGRLRIKQNSSKNITGTPIWKKGFFVTPEGRRGHKHSHQSEIWGYHEGKSRIIVGTHFQICKHYISVLEPLYKIWKDHVLQLAILPIDGA